MSRPNSAFPAADQAMGIGRVAIGEDPPALAEPLQCGANKPDLHLRYSRKIIALIRSNDSQRGMQAFDTAESGSSALRPRGPWEWSWRRS